MTAHEAAATTTRPLRRIKMGAETGARARMSKTPARDLRRTACRERESSDAVAGDVAVDDAGVGSLATLHEPWRCDAMQCDAMR